MKKLIIIMALLIAAPAMADLKVGLNMYQLNEGEVISLSEETPQLELDWQFRGPWSLVATAEQFRATLVGQTDWSGQMASLGLGYTHEINKRLRLRGVVSWYQPEWTKGHSGDEGVYLALRSYVGEEPPRFTDYLIKSEGALGAMLGVSIDLYKNVELYAGYRVLELPINMYGRNSECYWTYRKKADASGWAFGVRINFRGI